MSKVVGLGEAMGEVHDGMHVGLTGFAITRNAVAAALELIRTGRRGLRVTQVIGGLETDLLVGAGCVDSLVYSGGSLDRFGPLHCINRAIARGTLQVQEYSSLSLTFRLLAASLGLPYIPAKTLLGSDLLAPLQDSGHVRLGKDPFTGSPVVLLSALQPDVAIVHADICDEDGNAWVSGPTWALRETALAAGRVLVTAERVVARGQVPPDRATVPGAVVSVVAAVPDGARPTAVHDCYDYDRDLLTSYAAASKAGEGELWDRVVTARAGASASS